SPLLDLQLFKNRMFAAGNLAQFLNSLAWAGLLLLVAIYLQIGLGYSPLQAGLGIVPLELTYVVSSLICGKLSDKYGSRILCTTGLIVMAICYISLTTFNSFTQYYQVAVVLAIIGIGNGMFTSPNFRAIMSSVAPERRGVASSFRQTMFDVGSTVSYGVVILFITFGIPYSVLSPLLQSVGPLSVISAAKQQFIEGFKIAALLLAVVDIAAIFPSVMRGAREAEKPKIEKAAQF
ncbi:MAG: MFS transporter, partial [Thaumarchaeota archaeon]|nr:MFS transporter [Nitrososphaerota archaeon]